MADNVEMQGIEFQIVNDSAAAQAGLEALTATLTRLKNATNGSTSSLSKTAQSVKSLKDALSGLNSGDMSQKITRIASALKALEPVGNIKISSSIGNQLSAISKAADEISWTDGDKITALAEGLKPLSELGRANLTSFINQLGKLPDVIEKLDNADLEKFTQQMQELAAALEPFATEMTQISNGFSAFPSRIQKLITSTEKYNTTVKTATTNTNAFGTALTGLKLSSVVVVAKRVSSLISDVVYDATEWEGIVQRFNRAFGDAAQSNYEWIQRLNSEMQLNTQLFMQYASIYGTMLKGYGVATEDAAAMAMNYTELTYDIWAGYNDIYTSFEDAAIAVRAAIAGEVEPIRKAGFTIVDSQLKITAANYGIAYSTQSASEELKSYLRYLTLVDQAYSQDLVGTYAKEMTTAEGLMRTLRQEVTSLGQAFGSFLLPALVKILPYIQAFVELLEEAIVSVAALFNIEIQIANFSSNLSSGADAAEDLSDSLDSAESSAKDLKQLISGFDELNILSDSSSTSSDAVSTSGSYDDLFDIDKLWDESIFESINDQVDELKEKLEGVLTTVSTIAGGFLAWKVATGLLSTIETLKNLSSTDFKFKLAFEVLNFAGFWDAMTRFSEWVSDFAENGATLDNIVGMLTSFSGGVGYALNTLGHTKIGSVLILIDGLGEIFLSLKDIYQNGVNMDNVLDAVHGLGNVLVAVGSLTDNCKVTGAGFMALGITNIIKGLSESWEAIKEGDWSNVDYATLAIGAIELIGGFMTATGKLKGIVDKAGGSKAVSETTSTLQEVSTSVGDGSGSGLTGTLKSLAQNLGWGVLILTEVAGAAIIFVGAIAVLGHELEEVSNAWEPVIENGTTVLEALGLGTALIAAVGLAAYALGTGGGAAAAVNIGIGTAILAELGIATGLFIIEIWAIGKGLDEIAQAWQPVLDNGEEIAEAIGIGTGFLVAIGVVTAALGTITIGTAGLLPLAIAVGAGILGEMALACIGLVESLKAVADELNDELAPSLRDLNETLPQLTDDMSDFVDFICDFANEIDSYTDSMGSVTWDSIVSGFQKLFAGNPIGDFADDVKDIADDTAALNAELKVANPELKTAVKLMTEYSSLMEQLGILTQENGTTNLATGIFTNLETCGEKLVTGFATGMNNKMSLVTDSTKKLKSTLDTSFDSIVTSSEKKWGTGLSRMTSDFDDFQTDVTQGFGDFQTDVTQGFNEFTTDVTQNFDSLTTKLNKSLSTFSSEFSKGWSNVWDGMGNTVIIQWNSVLTAMEKGLNNALTSLNSVIRQNNKMSKYTGVTLDYLSKVSVAKIQYMASGGFVDEGQLFIAREAGAEMVGSIGGRTAVANNDQIVEGISSGVAEGNQELISAIFAMAQKIVSAVEESGDVYLDGDKVTSTVTRKQNRKNNMYGKTLQKV